LERNNGVWRRCLQGRRKKYYPQGGDFFAPLVIPLQVCFFPTKRMRAEYRFTCLVFCGALNIDLFRLKRISPKIRNADFGDFGKISTFVTVAFIVYWDKITTRKSRLQIVLCRKLTISTIKRNPVLI